MSTGVVEGHDAGRVDEKQAGAHHVDAPNSKVLGDTDFMNDAFDGENEEHELGMWEAVKSHPKACFWAFIMCFTIVSPATPTKTRPRPPAVHRVSRHIG